MWDETVEPVSRDQILRREVYRETSKTIFRFSWIFWAARFATNKGDNEMGGLARSNSCNMRVNTRT